MQYATTPKVVTAWLGSLPSLSTAMVDEQLPSDTSTWAASGFITPFVTGGSPNIYMPVQQPVVTLKFWTVDPDTGLPPWNTAENLAEIVRAGTFSFNTIGRALTVPYCDQTARVMSAYFLVEPRRSYMDAGDYACVTVDMAFYWVAT